MSESSRRIGAYVIERELGRGGMGVVYLASDPRLQRRVAIKVLPADVSHDSERLGRFEREARLLAALKHPNIGGIYGLEEADGQRFLVLEYLEGQTLARRLDAGPLRIAEALHVCRQIASALEAAHESGIIHRDLKPGNVMITDDDEVKVVDFGLAKGGIAASDSSSDLSASPTVTVGGTAAGVVLGTAAYMSPEQARGRSVDRRTDIWSFGCVLFECLSGRQLFGGETVSDTIARILEREPDWNALPRETPDRVRELLRRCLEKKARERLRDIGDARIELEEIESGKTSSASGTTAGIPLGRHRSQVRLAWGVAAVAVVAALVAWGTALLRPAAPPATPMRLEITMPPGLLLSESSEDIAISPDGARVVFVATDSAGASQLYMRELSTSAVTPVPNTRDAVQPFWSPDSRSIGFFSGAKLRTVVADGGTPDVLADVTSSRGGSWGTDYIVFAGAQGPIFRVPIDGGAVEPVTVVDSSAGQTAHRFPAFLPDGKRFMYSVLPPRTGMIKVFVSDVSRSRPKEILSANGCPAYVEPGVLVWRRGGRMMAQPFDVGRAEVRGKAFPVGPAPTRSNNLGAPPVSASRAGTIVELPPTQRGSHFDWRDWRGKDLGRLNLDERGYGDVRVSPDGRRIVTTIYESDYESDLWLIDLDRMTPTRLTFGPGSSYGPIWSPDGERVAYISDRAGPIDLYVKSISDPNSERRLVESGGTFLNAEDWSPDGRYVLFNRPGTGSGLDLWKARVDGDSVASQAYVVTPYNENEARISPDGRWCAYDSDESGRSEIYVTSFPEAGRKYRVSTEGGYGPGWGFDGRELLYISLAGGAMSVPVEAGESFRTGPPRRLYPLPKNFVDGAISPVDARFLLILNDSPVDLQRLIVQTGWNTSGKP